MRSVCFTPEEDLLLARGWPHLVRWVDGHSHDKSPARSALSWLAEWRKDKYHSEWPREVGYRALRLGPGVKEAQSTVAATKLRKIDLQRSETDGPPDAKSVKAALTKAAASFALPTTDSKCRDWVFLAEAILGADETLDAIATGFEATRVDARADMLRLDFMQSAAGLVGFLLLRAEQRDAHAARFAAQLARFAGVAATNVAWRRVARHLDASLNGAVALKRWFAGRWSVQYAEYAADDPDYVRAAALADATTGMTVRLVAIAGTSVLAGVTKRRWAADELPSVVRDFGMVRAPETVALVSSLVGKSSVKDAPLRWLRAHADYARPLVEAAARRGDARAKLVLSQLG